ncbi:Uncharacterized protein TPAR_05982, partial [Tolypocladium paradoxum]
MCGRAVSAVIRRAPQPLCHHTLPFHHPTVLGSTLLHLLSLINSHIAVIVVGSIYVLPSSTLTYASPPHPQAPPGQHLGGALHGRRRRRRPHAALPRHARRRGAPGQADDQVGAALGAQHLLLHAPRRAHRPAHGAPHRPRRPERREPPAAREDGQARRRDHQERHRPLRAQAVM